MIKSRFVKNSIILMATTFIIKIMAMVFRIFTVSKIGAEGIGVYQLVLTVFFLTVTVSTSAVTLCVTRVVTDCMATNQERKIKYVTKRCLFIAIAVSVFCSAVLFFFSKIIGTEFLSDSRTVKPLRILSLSLPFMATSASFRGYFYAKREASRTAIEQLIEQTVEILVFVIFIDKISNNSIEKSLCLITFGSLLSEIISCFYSVMCYKLSTLKLESVNELPKGFKKKLLSIMLPVTGSSCLRSGLSTIENTSIPNGLKKYGADSVNALSDYGTVSGMVMPILTFPSFILLSFATLLIPEISEAYSKGRLKTVKSICEKSYSLTLLFVIPFTVGFIFMGNEIGSAIYNDTASGYYISILAPIVPLMYLDSVTDGILKGLNQQLSYFTYNIIDSGIRVLLTFILIPLMGIKGYVIVIFVSEVLNTALSVNKLIKVTELRISLFKDLILPVLSALLSMYLSKILIAVNTENKVFSLILFSCAYFIIYILINTLTAYLNKIIYSRKNI